MQGFVTDLLKPRNIDVEPLTSNRAKVSTSARKPSRTYFVSSAQSKDEESTTQR